MSRANLIRYSHDLPLTEPATQARRALETELKADIQTVFDPVAANELYDKALLDYAGLGPSEERGETCDCYWDVVDDRRIQVFVPCAGPDVVVGSSKSAHERIPRKRMIMESIMLRGQRAAR